MNQTIVATFCAILMTVASMKADTLSVWTTANSGVGSLRQAIIDASPNDTIYILTTDTIRTTASLVFSKYFYSLNAERLSLSSGIYFYTMKTDGFSQTKKMILAK